ncbi:Hsp33 family molecular chaperone HslO [Sphingomonas tabacisoli]|uniref:Hsp33 family molecular chaperone HslO n=1 Tax=Sphingomonas tabacisoli TaxID=2249466 RepID=A0ABW4I4G1_9SPHN
MTTGTELDRTLGFAILEQHARGRLVRLGPVLDQILSAHAYPPVIERLLAEALALTALLGATLKDESGQMTLQAQTEAGPVELLVCDYKDGELRGYVQFDADKLAAMPADPTLFALFGKGYLAITFDQAVSKERYQGIVPLEGASLAEAAQSYFAQSEQIPSLVRLAHRHDADGRCIAGGMLLQHLPEGEEGRDRLHTRLDHPEWQHVEVLGATIKDEELTDPTLPMETVVWRLFHDEKEVRVLGGATLTRGCRCNREHILGVLSRFPAEEQAEMADTEGTIRVDCAFCSISHPIKLEELQAAA